MIIPGSVSRAMKATGIFALVLGLCALLAAQDLPPPNVILAEKPMPAGGGFGADRNLRATA